MAAYCRVSTEKEEQLSSLENQREFFEQYADKEGDTLVKIYADLPVTHLISYTVSAPCVPTVLMSDFCRIIRRL